MWQRFPSFEAIERRVLFSDIAESLALLGPQASENQPAPISLPDTIVGGQKKAKGKVAVTVTNTGDDKLKGPVTAHVFGSTDSTLDGNDVSLGSKTKKLKLNPGASKTLNVKVKFPTVGGDQEFLFLSQLTGTGVSDPNGIVTASAAPVEVQAPRISLAGDATTKGPFVDHFGQKLTLDLPITNNGNITASGSAASTLFFATEASLDPGSVVVQRQDIHHLHIKAGQTTVFHPHLGKFHTGDLSAGTYFFVIRLDNAGTDPTNETDGSIVGIFEINLS